MSTFFRVLLVVVITSFCLTVSIKANSDYNFQQITIEKGLSQSSVNCLFVDHKGLMWIGTVSGLNCYDWSEMKSYYQVPDDPNTLPGNYIFFVVEDSLYNVWVGTNNGLARYDKERETFIPIIKEKPFYSYVFTPDGIVFGGDGLFYQYTYQTQTVSVLPVKGDTSWKSFHRIIPWKDDNWLISDRGGWVWSYNTVSHLLEKAFFCKETNIASLSVDDEGNIYVAPYMQGVICYSADGQEKWHFTDRNSGLSSNIVLDILPKDGKLWIATDGGGLNILDEDMDISTLRHVPGNMNSLPVNSIYCLYKDYDNNMWMGSVRGGVIGVKETFIKTYKDAALNTTYGLSEKTVISLFEDEEGILWIGTDGGGLNRYDPFNDTFRHYPDTYNESIVSITDYSNEELLLFLYGKEPYLLNKKTGGHRPFVIVSPEITREIYNSLYITYGTGLVKIKYIYYPTMLISMIRKRKPSPLSRQTGVISGG